MKKNVLKQLFPIFVVLTLFACNNGKGGMIHMPLAPSVEDCERDYHNMVNGSYSTIENALNCVLDFISTYRKTDFPQLEDAYRIKMHLEDLKQFLAGPFDSVSDFIYLSNQKGLSLENCKYPMVKAVWNKALENKKTSNPQVISPAIPMAVRCLHYIHHESKRANFMRFWHIFPLPHNAT